MAKEVKYLDLEGLKALYGVVDGKITTAIDNAKTELKGDATDGYDTLGKLEDKIQEEATRAEGVESDLSNRLKSLESGDNSVGKQIEELETKLVGDAQNLKTFGDVEDAIEVINGDGEGSIKQAAADVVAKIVDGAPDKFDTLKEVAEWIGSDTTGAAQMQSDIATLKGGDTVEGSVAKSIKDTVEGLDATVETKEHDSFVDADHVYVKVEEVDGKLDKVTVETKDIASAATLAEVKTAQEANTALLEGIPTDKKVKDYVDEAVAAEADRAQGAEEANADAIAGAINEGEQTITLGGKELKFVAFTAAEIQDAAKPEASNPTEPNA